MAETAVAATAPRGSKSPKHNSRNASPKTKNTQIESNQSDGIAAKPETTTATEPAKPLAPPPRPGPQGNNTPDYFGTGIGGSLSLEPNPFEQSFGGAPPETPGGTKLPSVAALTSPSSLLPGGGTTPFNWGNSLRTGPLSPAMLSGPTNDYFSDTHHLRGGFPTPNESSLRTGLTPGGSGSMFPAASPNPPAIFAQLTGSGGATPSTIDFHRTALSAAAAKREQAQAQPQPPPPAVTSQPQELTNGNAVKTEATKPASGPFDPHDNDAANGLFMLAQGRNGAQSQSSFAVPTTQPQSVHAHPPPPMAPQQPQLPAQPSQPAASTSPQLRTTNGTAHGAGSDRGSVASEDNDHSKPATKGKGKKATAAPTTNGKRKADEHVAKAPTNKKSKTNGASVQPPPQASPEYDMSDNDEDDYDESKPDKDGNPRAKMTDDEKRKNFLERNRVAALKCRQRKKQWLANLQNKVEIYTQENETLSAQVAQLREEVVNLKTLLLAHKDCPVTQQQTQIHTGFVPQGAMEYNPQLNPYALGGTIPGQPVMNGQPVGRRYS